MFSALSTSALPRITFLHLAAYVVVQFLLIGLVIGVGARIGRWDRGLTAGMLLAAFNVSGVTPPAPVAKAAQILAGGAVAVMLLLVGAQLSTVRLEGEWRVIAIASATRLVFAPIVAWGTAGLLGLDGVVRQTSILQASLPTAVTSAIWASEFGAEPALVSSAVVVTTLLSPVTITPLLVLLR